MVFAKTSKCASRLSEQVREKQMHKKYLCIVDGKMEKDSDCCTGCLHFWGTGCGNSDSQVQSRQRDSFDSQ